MAPAVIVISDDEEDGESEIARTRTRSPFAVGVKQEPRPSRRLASVSREELSREIELRDAEEREQSRTTAKQNDSMDTARNDTPRRVRSETSPQSSAREGSLSSAPTSDVSATTPRTSVKRERSESPPLPLEPSVNEESEDSDVPRRRWRRVRRPENPVKLEEQEEDAVPDIPANLGLRRCGTNDHVDDRRETPRRTAGQSAHRNDADITELGSIVPKPFNPATGWNENIAASSEWDRKPYAHEIIETMPPFQIKNPVFYPVLFDRQRFLSKYIGGNCQSCLSRPGKEKLALQELVFGRVICKRYHCEMLDWNPRMPKEAGHHGVVYYKEL